MVNPMSSTARTHALTFLEERHVAQMLRQDVFTQEELHEIPDGYHAVVTVKLEPDIVAKPMSMQFVMAKQEEPVPA